MKTIRLLALVLFFSILISPFAFADEMNKAFATFSLGTNTVIAASATNSGIYRIPMNAKIDSIYLTNATAVASDATDYVTLTFYLNNASYGTITTNGAAAGAVSLVATTPALLTPTAKILAAGDIVQFKLTKGGSGKAMSDIGVTLSYFGSTSN